MTLLTRLSLPVLVSCLWLVTSARGHEASRPAHPATPGGGTATGAADCELSLSLTDPSDGRVLAGCVRLSADGGETWSPLTPLLPRLLGLSPEKLALGWHTVPGAVTVRVPRTEVIVEAFSGIETRRPRMALDLRNRERHEVKIPLERLFDASRHGWVPGNTHLHLQKLTREEADRYLVEVSEADALEVVFVSYLERALVDRGYITNAYSADDLARLSRPGLVFGTGEEYRHNFGPGGEAYGHLLMLDLASRVLPASLGPGITGRGTDGTPLRPGLARAREDGATIVWCHNAFGLEDLPNWLSGHVHAQNIFDGGNRGSYEDTFYRYLNLGMRVPFSTGTDWFIYDFSRAYVALPEGGAVTARSWLAALRKGRSVITNGVWIEFTVDGNGPGSALDFPVPGEVSVSARVIGRHDFGSLELVRNGRVIRTQPATGGDGRYEARLEDWREPVGEPFWLAARIRPAEGVTNELGEPLFAHTSAVQVRLKGEEVFLPEVAEEVRRELEESRERIGKEGLFENEAERDSVLRIYREAAGKLPTPDP